MSELPEHWRAAAIAPPRAGGATLGRGVLRADPAHFVVDEDLGFEPRGSGEHWLLRVRKTEANTDWVARELARHGRVRPQDVGFAGLKDRHAVTTQWFSVPRAPRGPASWDGHAGPGYRVLGAVPHDRKLRRGALRGNRFEIVVSDCAADGAPIDAEALQARLELLARTGVPNYFGPQRFGRELSNLARALALSASAAVGSTRQHADRAQRGFAYSAARSLIFNAVLARRVADGSWNRLQLGDIANFDDGATVFAVTAPDAHLHERCAAGQIHPTGPLWGKGGVPAAAATLALEAQVASLFAPLDRWLLGEGLEAERRALRLRLQDFRWDWQPQQRQLRVSFALNAGGFATTVLREIFDCDVR